MSDPLYEDKDFMKAIGLIYDTIIFDEEHEKLRQIITDELTETHKVMSRSPELLARGKMMKHRTLAEEFDGLPVEDGEAWDDYLVRVEAEGDRRGSALVMRIIEKEVVYWDLTGTDFVYVNENWIGKLDSEDNLQYVFLGFLAKPYLEAIIQGLRLLRTPFNDAV